MDLQDQHEQEPVPKRSELSSLEDVRTTLAGDVIQFLAVATTSSEPEDPSPGASNASPGQRQLLLCAAVADLDAIDERLHHARR